MIRRRARSQGLLGYLDDGSPLREYRAKVTKAARKAEAALPAPGSRTCPDCSTPLSRYTRGPYCQCCDRRRFVEGEPR